MYLNKSRGEKEDEILDNTYNNPLNRLGDRVFSLFLAALTSTNRVTCGVTKFGKLEDDLDE